MNWYDFSRPEEVQTARYLSVDHNKCIQQIGNKRSLLCQLRIGILPLEIETGRYTRKKVEDIICKLCKLDIEDEIHFVCVCPKLQAIRCKYYNKICSRQNDSILTQFYEM